MRAQTSNPELSSRHHTTLLLLLLLLLHVNTVRLTQQRHSARHTFATPVVTKQAGLGRTSEEDSARSDSAETSASRWKSSGSNERRKLRLKLKPSRAHLRPMNICAPGSG